MPLLRTAQPYRVIRTPFKGKSGPNYWVVIHPRVYVHTSMPFPLQKWNRTGHDFWHTSATSASLRGDLTRPMQFEDQSIEPSPRNTFRTLPQALIISP